MKRAKFIEFITVIAIMFIFVIPNFVSANVVEYRGEAEGLVVAPEDFFIDFGNLLPGDTKEDKAIIKNKTNDKIKIYFKTELIPENENRTEIDKSLLEVINLKITLKNSNEEKLLYDGNLGAESLSKDYILLGTYEKGFDGEFIFKIDVPIELDNTYSLAENEVKWVFYVEKLDDNNNEPKTDDENKNNSTNDKDDANKNNNNIINNIINNVKTGDYILYVVGLIIVLVIINIIIICIRRKKEDEK